MYQENTSKFASSMRQGALPGSKNPGRTDFVNFGDLPISVAYFLEFLASKTFKNDDSYYSLTRFLNQLFNNLVNNFLNSQSCFAFDISQKVRVNQNVLTSYSPHSRPAFTRDEITHLMLIKAEDLRAKDKNNAEPYINSPARLKLSDRQVRSYNFDKNRAVLNVSGQSGHEESLYAPLSHEINYFTIFAARTQPVDKMTGNKSVDLQGGIFHYLLGRDRGLVKSIKLQKTQTPGLQEVRFEQQGYEGLEQLRVVYDVEIECYANVNTFPGTYIYIPPEGFDPSMGKEMTKYGVGGYYMIYRSNHHFAAGEATTKIYAKWVAQAEFEANKEDAERNNSSNHNLSKCSLPGRDTAVDQ